MASLPPSRRFGLTQDPQPSPLITYESYSFSSRSSSLGDDTPDKGSPAYFGGDLSPTTPRRERTSRYLSEGDRKEIIARVDGGEKQVALAKEFNVSRAAICNLYKNRWEVLTRGVRDPTATHPKKSRKALTCLPHDEEELTNKYGDLCHTTKALDASDSCAVSMEDRDMVLLRAFSDISPTSPTGVVSIETRFFESSLSPPQIYAQLPPINQQQFVLLLDIECAAGEKACAVLHHLVNDRQIPARNIYFVTVISDFEGLQNVFRHFPDVSLVTAQVDTVLDEQRIRPGISDFLQRYRDVNSPG